MEHSTLEVNNNWAIEWYWSTCGLFVIIILATFCLLSLTMASVFSDMEKNDCLSILMFVGSKLVCNKVIERVYIRWQLTLSVKLSSSGRMEDFDFLYWPEGADSSDCIETFIGVHVVCDKSSSKHCSWWKTHNKQRFLLFFASPLIKRW